VHVGQPGASIQQPARLATDTRPVRDDTSVPKRLLTTREVAERLSVSVFTVRGFAVRGVLPVVRFTPTSRMRFRPGDVDRLVELSR